MLRNTKFHLHYDLLFIIAFLFASKLYAQINWTDVSQQPVLDYGAAGEWDYSAVRYAKVIKDGDTLRMWYSGAENSGINGKNQIGYAWSINGIDWYRHPNNPVLTGDLSWEYGQIVSGPVIKDGNMFKMWYSAGYSQGKIIGYATSIDGINWQKHPDPVLQRGLAGEWDNGFIEASAVIKEGNVYKMWFWGGTDVYIAESLEQIGLATSADGINWVKFNKPFTQSPFLESDPVVEVGKSGDWDSHRIWSPSVLSTESGYEMWYTGTSSTYDLNDQIGYTTSTDGITWIKWSTNPIITTYPSWGRGYTPDTILKLSGCYHMWYASYIVEGSDHRARIGYATSGITGIEMAENKTFIPSQYRLSQNYPNPFNPTTTINYQLPITSDVELSIYNLLGQNVATLVSERQKAGTYNIEYHANDLASGIYLIHLKAGDFIQTNKMILQK